MSLKDRRGRSAVPTRPPAAHPKKPTKLPTGPAPKPPPTIGTRWLRGQGPRKPVGVVYGEEGCETVVCDDGSVWALHFGDYGPDGWHEIMPIPGTTRAFELTPDGDTTVPREGRFDRTPEEQLAARRMEADHG